MLVSIPWLCEIDISHKHPMNIPIIAWILIDIFLNL